MKPGYIYIASNKSHVGPLLKIGYTIRDSSERVKEFFSGKTSVPEKFILNFSCSVHDCVDAEQQIHKILDSYRHKHNREFFVIKIDAAKTLIVNICTKINDLYGVPAPIIENGINDSEKNLTKDEFVFYADPKTIQLPTKPQSTLNINQRLRVEVLYNILNEANPEPLDSMIKEFEMDLNPENEIKVYEAVAKEYCKINSILSLKPNQLNELYKILVYLTLYKSKKLKLIFSVKYLKKHQFKMIINKADIKVVPLGVHKH